MEILNLPEFLKKNKRQIAKAKIVCLVNRQIPMPHHLQSYDSSKNIPVLVDIIGVDIPQEGLYYVKGRGVAILGPTSLAPTETGENRILLLESNIQLVDNHDTFVSLTNIYYNKSIKGYFLYATKTLFRDVELINNAYPEFVKVAKKAQKVGCNACFDSINIPTNYIEASKNVIFDEIDEKDRFVFKTKEDWHKEKELNSENIVDLGVDLDVEPPFTTSDSIQKSQGNKQELVCRSEIEELPEAYTVLENGILKSKDAVEAKLDDLSKYEGSYEIEEAISYTYRQLKRYWKKPKAKGLLTGRAVFKEVLGRMYPDYKEKRKGTTSPIDIAIDDSVYPALDTWYLGSYSGPTNKFLEEIQVDREKIYIEVIDFFLGLRGRLTEGYNYGKTLGLDMFSIIKSNPYYLTMIDNRFTIEHLDKLGMLYGVNIKDRDIQALRNAAYLHNLMLDSDNPNIKDDTIIKKDVITRIFTNGYILSKRTYDVFKKDGTVLDISIIDGLKVYVEPDIDGSQFSLPTNDWKEIRDGSTSKYVRNIEGEDKRQAIQDYIDSGMGVELDYEGAKYLSDYYYASKEKYIIDRLYDLYSNGYKPETSSEDVDDCIRSFERQKSLELNIPNFALEDRQKEAVRILENPVMCVTGPAGSGKTTTAEALVYGLQSLLGISEEDIMFCAPTGKAANRLKEVVKKPTRTIHSLFLVGADNRALLEDKDVKKKSDLGVLIVDESSMIKVELMYNMITKLSNGTRVYFLGDREQLPPIGFGKPFANLLTFLPTVVLNVTKRASDSSGITRNAKKIIYESDGPVIEDLEQTDDFRILKETKERVVDSVKGICKYHLGQTKLKSYQKAVQNLGTDLIPDDIQIITPVNKHNWGTRNLNKELQDIFNPQQGLALKFAKDYTTEKDEYGNTKRVPFYVEYRKNDRVIHLENQNKAARFIKEGSFSFRKLDGSEGVMNGDVGKIEGFYKASQIVFIDDEDNDLGDDYPSTPTAMYVAVEYSDIDEAGIPLNYIILYKVDKLEDRPDERNILEVVSLDLQKLDLAYALTVHKLQGSQAKLIICVFFKVGYSNDFISRNMLYTAITRAKESAYLIGDVLGPMSVVSTGRRIEQVGKRLTISDKIFI